MKPRERIVEISKKYSHWKLEDSTPDYIGQKLEAVIDFLDEQYEKEYMASAEAVYETKVKCLAKNKTADMT